MPSVLAVDDGAIEKSKIKMDLADYENAFHSIFKSTPNAVIIYDSGRIIRFVNPSFTRTFGYQKEEVMGRHLPGFFHIPVWDQEKTDSEITDLLLGKPVSERATKRMAKDGREINVAIAQSVTRITGRKLTNILTIIQEITAEHYPENIFIKEVK